MISYPKASKLLLASFIFFFLILTGCESSDSGEAADLIIVDQNIFEIDPMDIHKTEVLRTLVEGKTVYEVAKK